MVFRRSENATRKFPLANKQKADAIMTQMTQVLCGDT